MNRYEYEKFDTTDVAMTLANVGRVGWEVFQVERILPPDDVNSNVSWHRIWAKRVQEVVAPQVERILRRAEALRAYNDALETGNTKLIEICRLELVDQKE